ncbi:tryptophan synthase subunit alpha [Nonomuraea rubra]|uniref:tryptophan synthase subunit alpha n=1 Tax=Nonomuraea rubra TaxID=46180 RepID=UPI003613FC5D
MTPGWTDYLRAFAAAGADAIEVGLPFSDPTLDGVTIQQASQAALARARAPAASWPTCPGCRTWACRWSPAPTTTWCCTTAPRRSAPRCAGPASTA